MSSETTTNKRPLFRNVASGNVFYDDGTYGESGKSKWWVEDGKVMVRPISSKIRFASNSVQECYQRHLAKLITDNESTL